MAHILIIDDELSIRVIFEKILTFDGHTVDTAENGKIGLEKFDQAHYDLVITDIVMPERDGFEVIKELYAKSPKIKIIAITGGTLRLGQDYLMSVATVMKVNKVFAKPINFDELKAGVNELLEILPTITDTE